MFLCEACTQLLVVSSRNYIRKNKTTLKRYYKIFFEKRSNCVRRYLFRVAATRWRSGDESPQQLFSSAQRKRWKLQYLHSNCSRENHARIRQLTRRELSLASRRVASRQRWWWIVTGSSARLFCSVVVARKPRSSCKQTKLRARINWNSVEMCARTYEHSFEPLGDFRPSCRDTQLGVSSSFFVIDHSW